VASQGTHKDSNKSCKPTTSNFDTSDESPRTGTHILNLRPRKNEQESTSSIRIHGSRSRKPESAEPMKNLHSDHQSRLPRLINIGESSEKPLYESEESSNDSTSKSLNQTLGEKESTSAQSDARRKSRSKTLKIQSK